MKLFFKLTPTLAVLAMLATPALSVDYLVHDQDGHGTSKCEFAQAVEVDIAAFDYSSGDRTFMCLAPIPTGGHAGIRGGGGGGTLAVAPEVVTPAPVEPVEPDPVDPVEPDPVDPGECLKVSDCPNEPDPKPDPDPEPCERKVDCVGPAPDPEPTGPRLCNAKGECRP